MPWPLIPFVVGGAALGAGLAAGLGPEEEPLWKKLLVGGTLGGLGGAGLGSAMAPAAASAAAPATGAMSAAQASQAAGLGSTAGVAMPTLAPATPTVGGMTVASGVPGALPTATSATNSLGMAAAPAALPGAAPAAQPSLFQQVGDKSYAGLEKVGQIIADNPLPAAMGGAGLGTILLPGSPNGNNGGGGYAKPTYQGAPSWERRQSPFTVRPTSYMGRYGVGQRYFS